MKTFINIYISPSIYLYIYLSMHIYIYIYLYIYIYEYIYIFVYINMYQYIVQREYKQHLLETFYIVTNSFTLSLDSNPQTIRNIMKKLVYIYVYIYIYIYIYIYTCVFFKKIYNYILGICHLPKYTIFLKLSL